MNLHQRPEATGIGPGGAFDSKWVPPVGGAPSRHTGTGGAGRWGTGDRRSRVVPRNKQLGKQPDEAMPGSRGDARTAERARTGGAKTAPCLARSAGVCVCVQGIEVLLRSSGSNGPRFRDQPRLVTIEIERWACFCSKRQGTARGPLTAAFCNSHKAAGGDPKRIAPEGIAPLVSGFRASGIPADWF
jgi:hypothetical protein